MKKRKLIIAGALFITSFAAVGGIVVSKQDFAKQTIKSATSNLKIIECPDCKEFGTVFIPCSNHG